MSDVLERLRNIVKAARHGTSELVRRETLAAAVEELERLTDLSDVKTGMSWMRSCDELTAECFRHKAEIERLQDVERDLNLAEQEVNIYRDKFQAAEQVADTLRKANIRLSAETARLQADVDRLMPLAAAVGVHNPNDVPVDVWWAWKEPSGYRQDKLVRLRDALTAAESRHGQDLREARAEIATLVRDRDRLSLLAANHAIANERLKASLAEAERETETLHDEAVQLIVANQEARAERDAANARLQGERLTKDGGTGIFDLLEAYRAGGSVVTLDLIERVRAELERVRGAIPVDDPRGETV